MKKIVFAIFIFMSVTANAQFFAGVEAKAGISNYAETFATGKNSGFSYFAGAYAGYEFFKHVPVSAGIEYGELKMINQYTGHSGEILRDAEKQTGLRIPVKVGYCHYFDRLRPFVNAGVFYSIKNKMKAGNTSQFKMPEHFGYLGQVGIGYKISDKLTVSAAYEYNRPFNHHAKMSDFLYYTDNYLIIYYSGAVINASIYF
jgi:opacity protein-like surface antigen